MKTPPRVLFILKHRPPGPPGSWSYSHGGDPLSSGLAVSVQQMVAALEQLGIEAKAVHVVDNNSIHREVVKYKPTHAIIEGFWVVPDKFKELMPLSPDVEYIVRCHSNTEFLAHEGVVFGWALDYLERGVTVGFNSPTAAETFVHLAHAAGRHSFPGRIAYLPNYYDLNVGHLCISKEILRKLVIPRPQPKLKDHFQVGCFGAIRPLKNTMNQALAALEVADRLNLMLCFHVNASRVENQGDALLRSLRSLFERVGPRHVLVEDPWAPHDSFLQTLGRMDMVTQVSFSETFNIVSADAVATKVPVIGASIPWLPEAFQAVPTDVHMIANVMHRTWIHSGNGSVQDMQHRALADYINNSKTIWKRFLNTK